MGICDWKMVVGEWQGHPQTSLRAPLCIPLIMQSSIILLLCVFCAPLSARSERPQKPPGKYFPSQAREHNDAASFEYGQPIVGTTYFYWYDIETKSHIINRNVTDALTIHPADMNDISYKRVSWHRTQLKDMIAAGIDFLMPVFWGVPGKYDGWSFAGLPPLVEAHSALQKVRIPKWVCLKVLFARSQTFRSAKPANGKRQNLRCPNVVL